MSSSGERESLFINVLQGTSILLSTPLSKIDKSIYFSLIRPKTEGWVGSGCFLGTTESKEREELDDRLGIEFLSPIPRSEIRKRFEVAAGGWGSEKKREEETVKCGIPPTHQGQSSLVDMLSRWKVYLSCQARKFGDSPNKELRGLDGGCLSSLRLWDGRGETPIFCASLNGKHLAKKNGGK